MSVREAINKRPGTTALVVAVLIGVVVYGSVFSSAGNPKATSKAYFSDDDGKTYFVDDIEKIVPFDHEGKPAVRAMVYKCADKPPFVSYLLRYNEGGRAKLADPALKGEAGGIRNSSSEVKRPGDTNWVPLFSAKGEAISMHPLCPDGNRATNLSP